VGEVAPDIPTINEIGENALHFVQVNRHAQPFKCICDVIERDLVLIENVMYTFEEIPIGDSLAFFQKEVSSLATIVIRQVEVRVSERHSDVEKTRDIVNARCLLTE
jgi:hypothetical protein